VLDPAEARTLLDSIDVATHAGLRDRALIGLMVYSFGRIGAALGMTFEDVYTQNRRLWVRLREKGGKRDAMPCHHNLEEYLTAYLDGAGLRGDPKGTLFRTIGRGTSAPRRRASKSSSAITALERPGSPPISRTAARSKRPLRWRTMPRRARRSSMIVGATRSASMRSSGS
jgi:integrase/recombinase XerC